MKLCYNIIYYFTFLSYVLCDFTPGNLCRVVVYIYIECFRFTLNDKILSHMSFHKTSDKNIRSDVVILFYILNYLYCVIITPWHCMDLLFTFTFNDKIISHMLFQKTNEKTIGNEIMICYLIFIIN